MENEPVEGILMAWTDTEQKGFRDGYVEGFLNSARLMKWLIEREHLEHRWAYEAVLRYTNSVLSHWKERERHREHPPYHSKEQYDPVMRQIIEQVSELQKQEEPTATSDVEDLMRKLKVGV